MAILLFNIRDFEIVTVDNRSPLTGHYFTMLRRSVHIRTFAATVSILRGHTAAANAGK